MQTENHNYKNDMQFNQEQENSKDATWRELKIKANGAVQNRNKNMNKTVT